MTGRELAFLVLARVEREAAWTSRALDAELERARLTARERALATEIVYGVLRQRGRIDRALHAVSRKGLRRLDPVTRSALRAGAYQLIALSRVPDFAAVDRTVAWIKERRGARMAGLANALLRRLAQDGEPPSPSLESDPEAYLEGLSTPSWLSRRLINQMGPQRAARLAKSQIEPAPLTLRANTLRIDRLALRDRLSSLFPGGTFEMGKLTPEALVVEEAGAPHRWKVYKEGLFSVQDEAAQLVSHVVAPEAGWRVLDACAGIGSKSTHLATLMRDCGQIDAIDTNETRIGHARVAARRLGLKIVHAARADLLTWDLDGYDAVLLDAPCSGLGVLRRHPEIKWRTPRPNFAAHGQNQLRLLDAAAERVRVGGVLVYAVCTFVSEETEAPLRHFLARRVDFRVEDLAGGSFSKQRENEGTYRTWTDRDGADSFFIVRLRRR